jgi:alpha-glucuronidase
LEGDENMAKKRFAARWGTDFLTAFLLVAAFAAGTMAHTQTEDPAWLDHASGHERFFIPTSVRPLGSSELEQSAVVEIERGIERLTGAKVASVGETVVGTLDEVRAAFPGLQVPAHLAAHGFWLKRTMWQGQPLVIVAGSNEHGALFGAFDLLRRVATGTDISHLDTIEAPAMPIRWVDEWDNVDGTVTRGYDGRSIFFEGGKVRGDLSAVTEYSRLLASVGINGCNVNNVNDAAPFLEPDMIKGLARIADAMRPWGVRLAISVDIASPRKSAASRPSIRSTRKLKPGGPRRSTRSTSRFPTSRASQSKPIPKDSPAPQATAAARPTQPMCSRTLLRRTAAWCSIALSSTTIISTTTT